MRADTKLFLCFLTTGCIKCNLFTSKMAIIFPRLRSIEVIFPDKVPVNPSNVSAKFLWNNRNRLWKSWKFDFFIMIMAAILWNLEQLSRYSALHSRTIQGMCICKIGIYVTLRCLEPTLLLKHTFWILLRWQLQRYQKHVDLGPKAHVGPNYKRGQNSHIYEVIAHIY